MAGGQDITVILRFFLTNTTKPLLLLLEALTAPLVFYGIFQTAMLTNLYHYKYITLCFVAIGPSCVQSQAETV